jgi:microcystin-dependent protein
MFAGKTTPAGYLFCNGTAYATTTYPALYNVIGFYYGQSGLLFRVPDLTNKFPRGATLATLNTGTTVSVGVTTGGSYTIASSNLPNHTHELPTTLVKGITFTDETYGAASGGRSVITTVASVAVENNQTYTVDNGYGNADYYQPYTVVGYIIKY